MATLSINNSFSKLQELSEAELKDLRGLLSYKLDNQSAYFSGKYNNIKYLIDKKGNFPTGLLHIVKNYFNINKVLTIDNRIKPKPIAEEISIGLDVTPYAEQVDAVSAALDFHRGIITAPTGFGKSIIIALLIKQLRVKTLVVVPTLELKRQLSDSLKRYFGKFYEKLLTVENIDALSLDDKYDYGGLIVDEAHHSAAKTYRVLNRKCWDGIYYRFFLTATPFRSQTEETMLMESVTGQVIYKVDYKKAVERGYIVPIEAYYYELPKVKVKGTGWQEVYRELVVDNNFRNNLISETLAGLNSGGVSSLCLVKEIKHGENIQGGVFPFVTGLNELTNNHIKDFNEKKELTLIGTNGILGEGVDTKPAECVLIAGLGKSKNQFMQQVGRVLRKYPGKESGKVILFYDPSHKFTKSHFKEQCKILKEEYGVIPLKLEI